MIRLNVFIQVEKSCRDKVLDIARKLTECSLKEPGCVAYDIFESSTRPDVLMICETWKDADALSIHEQTAHFVSYVGKMKELSAKAIGRKSSRFDCHCRNTMAGTGNSDRNN